MRLAGGEGLPSLRAQVDGLWPLEGPAGEASGPNGKDGLIHDAWNRCGGGQ